VKNKSTFTLKNEKKRRNQMIVNRLKIKGEWIEYLSEMLRRI